AGAPRPRRQGAHRVERPDDRLARPRGTRLRRGEMARSGAPGGRSPRGSLWQDARLLATCKDGRAHLNAYLDDHAYLLAALIELMQTGFRRQDLDWAIEIADALLHRFEDAASGGFFFTSDAHATLINRPNP